MPDLKDIETYITAAFEHADNAGEADHEVGDLQDMLRETWEIMTPDQRDRFVKSDVALAVLEGAGMVEEDEDA